MHLLDVTVFACRLVIETLAADWAEEDNTFWELSTG